MLISSISNFPGASSRRGGPAHVPLAELLAFLAAVRIASVAQFARAFAHDYAWAYKRLRALRNQGLADRKHEHRSLPAAYFVSADGLATIGLPRSRPPRLSLDRLAHDFAITEGLLEFRPRAELTPERELLREPGQESLLRLPSRRNAGPKTHCPDLVAVNQRAEHWGVEIEFARKGAARLSAILAGYRSSRRYAGVVYFVRDAAMARLLARCASEQRLGRGLRIAAWIYWPRPSREAREIEEIALAYSESCARQAAPGDEGSTSSPAAGTAAPGGGGRPAAGVANAEDEATWAAEAAEFERERAARRAENERHAAKRSRLGRGTRR